MKKVSICIPAYNNAASVERLLLSIEKQSYKDYEVIITDDSDGDEIEKLVQKKEYVRYYKNTKRLGATANWNEAIAKSSGEYVKIMHHDDWFTGENSLKAYADMLEEHAQVGLAFSGSRQIEADGSYDRCISVEDVTLIKQDYRNLYLGNTIGAPSAVIVRRSVLGSEAADGQGCITYDEKLTWLVDMEYYMNILKKNPHVTYTTEPLVSIGVGKEQLTESCRDDKELNAFEYGYIYKKYQLGSKKEYREKLIHILAQAGKRGEDAAVYGIEEKEYRMEEKRKMASKIKWKLTHALNAKALFFLMLLVFAISLIPILGLSGVNHATGDDFGYGKLTHEAWIATHSPIEVIKAAGETVKGYYNGWQGTWLSVFLFTLQPEVFSSRAYIIVPCLMLALWLGSTGLLTYYLLVKKGGFSKEYWGIVYLLFAMAGIQFVPSTRSAIYWYNGNAHYTIPYAIALLGIYFYFRFMDGEMGKGIGFYIGWNICMILLGGVNYQAALLTPIVMVLAAVFCWKDRAKRKRIPACIPPLVLELAGLVISIKAPGNKVRGGEDFGFHLSAAAGTVLSCFVKGIVQACQYVREHPLLLLFFAFVAIVLWRMPREYGEQKRYPFPVVFVILSYCVYCAGFAPELYAGVEVSGGVYNMNYYMFLFMIFGDLIYAEGALAYRIKERKLPKIFLPAAAVAALAFLLVFRSDVKQTTTFRCVDYVRSGRAADFKQQMEYQLSVLLDDSIKEVILPMLNDDQGPLMHMPVTDNPDAWTNGVVRDFYGKNSVTGVPGEVWLELQKTE